MVSNTETVDVKCHVTLTFNLVKNADLNILVQVNLLPPPIPLSLYLFHVQWNTVSATS